MCKASSTYEDYVYGQASQQASEATYQFLLAVESSGGMLRMRLVLEHYNSYQEFQNSRFYHMPKLKHLW